MISLIRTVLTVKMTEKITLKKIFINFALSLFFYWFLLSRLTLLQSDLHIKKKNYSSNRRRISTVNLAPHLNDLANCVGCKRVEWCVCVCVVVGGGVWIKHILLYYKQYTVGLNISSSNLLGVRPFWTILITNITYTTCTLYV